MTAASAVRDLVGVLSQTYPTRTAALSNRPGRVTCVVAPLAGEYEPIACDPTPLRLEVEVRVLAAGSDEKAVEDLLTHLDAVAGIARTAGFTPTSWRAGQTRDWPDIAITCVADTTG